MPAPVPEPEVKPPPTAAPSVNSQPAGSDSSAAAIHAPIPPREVISEGSINQFKLSFQNASHSECIVLADYVGYEDNGEIRFSIHRLLITASQKFLKVRR